MNASTNGSSTRTTAAKSTTNGQITLRQASQEARIPRRRRECYRYHCTAASDFGLTSNGTPCTSILWCMLHEVIYSYRCLCPVARQPVQLHAKSDFFDTKP
jgi:hypothetical protein